MKSPLVTFSQHFKSIPGEVILQQSITSFSDIIKYMVIHPAKTYHADGNIQCYGGKLRSLEDICKCAQYHLGFSPKRTIKSLADMIVNSSVWFNFDWCSDVKYFTARYDFSLPYTGVQNLEALNENWVYYEDLEDNHDFDHNPELAMRALIYACEKLIKK